MTPEWQAPQLRRVMCSLCDGPFGSSLKSSHYSDEGVRVIRLQNIGTGRFRDDDAAYVPPEHFETLVGHDARAGDLLIAALGDENHPVGRSCVLPTLFGPALVKADCFRARLDPDAAHAPFVAYWMNSAVGSAALSSQAKGTTRSRISLEAVRELRVPLPALPTQRAIADFLDHKTLAIDALIEKKERLLALLEEKRAALIHRAVTKGLDPNVPMKDSGVPWVGEIPAHWEVRPTRYLVDPTRPIMYGIVLPGPHFEGGVPIVKANNCRQERLRVKMVKRTRPEIEARYVRSRLKRGDVVIAIRGSVGSTAIVPGELEEANLTQDAARLSPSNKLRSRWLWYLSQSEWFYAYTTPRIAGSTVKGLNIWDLARVPIPDVPVDEQRRLEDYLAAALSPIRRARELGARGIALLHEYRHSLITHAVTGQLDIPEKAA